MNKQALPKLKICGMRYLSNVKDVLQFKPDYLGFIFYVESKRFISAYEMDRIIKLDFDTTERVGVFVNEALDVILSLHEKGYFEIVQLHGDESPADVEELKQNGLKVIKAISVGQDFNEQIMVPYEGKVDYFLFDTKGKHRGGNGWKFDWNILKSIEHKTPFFLSGGLNASDVQKAMALNIPQMEVLDFNSHLEAKHGLKNIELVDELMKSFKKASLET